MNLSSTIVMVPRSECDKALKELARDSVQSRFSALQQNEGHHIVPLELMALCRL